MSSSDRQKQPQHKVNESDASTPAKPLSVFVVLLSAVLLLERIKGELPILFIRPLAVSEVRPIHVDRSHALSPAFDLSLA